MILANHYKVIRKLILINAILLNNLCNKIKQLYSNITIKN
mgnify:CR=1 FL=1